MGKWKWTLVVWVLLRLILNFGIGDLWAAQNDHIEMDLSQKKKELKNNRRELYQKKVKEKEIRGKESSVSKRLHQVTQEVRKKEKRLKKMGGKMDQIKERLEQTTNQIMMLHQELKQSKEKFSLRLAQLYKMKKIPFNTFLFISASYSDLLRMDKYLRATLDSDVRLINIYQHQLELEATYQEDLIHDRSQLLRSINKAEEKKNEVERVRMESRALLKSIQSRRTVYQKIIGKLEERGKRLQILIDKLGQRKNILAYGKSKNKIIQGKVLSPVEGHVMSLFKEKGQNGIKIKAPMGATVRALLPGRILYADWFKGYGNVVIIDHGNQIFTVSAYCSKFLKKVGDIVSLGEPIALVGSEDSSKASGLYFEIRHLGKPQDPMEWVSSLKTQRNPGKP
jgi:septal ring factor EnvC (AmiA/AmiB activator)